MSLSSPSTFGALNGVILSGPRAYFAMARDGLLVSWAAAIHPRFQTPHRAILLQGLWAVIVFPPAPIARSSRASLQTNELFLAPVLAAGLFRLRARADYRPAIVFWGYPVVPIFSFCLRRTSSAIRLSPSQCRA